MVTALTTTNINQHNSTQRIWRVLAIMMAALIALFAFSPSEAYAQNSIEELTTNKNADGYDRVSTTKRVFTEIGLGMISSVAVPGALFGWTASAGQDAKLYLFTLTVAYYFVLTPITAELVYQGGRITGGRGVRWPSYVGGYAGFVTGGVFCLGGLAGAKPFWIVAAIAAPVLSLAGSIIGYELSEKNETDRLRSKRDKLLANQSRKSSEPIMITLYSGRF